MMKGQVGFLIFRAPGERALDRMAALRIQREITPAQLQTLDNERLLKRHQARLSFSSGISVKALLIVTIIIGAFLAVMYFGGFYD